MQATLGPLLENRRCRRFLFQPWQGQVRMRAQLLSVRLNFDSTDCSLPGSSVHGFSQVKTLEWVAIFFSRGSSQLRDQTQVCCVSCIVGRFLTAEPLGKAWITSVLTARLHCCGMKEATDKMSDKGDGWTARKLHFWKQATGHLRPQATLWQPSP